MTERHRSGPGALEAVHGVLFAVYVLAVGGGAAVAQSLLQQLQGTLSPEAAGLGLLLPLAPAVLGALGLGVIGTGIAVVVRASRMQSGERGRMRLLALGWSAITHVLLFSAAAGMATWAAFRAEQTGLLVTYDPSELLIAMTPVLVGVFYVLCAVASLALKIAIVSDVAAWFLVAPRVRSRIWIVVDTLLLAGFVFVTVTLPIEPPEGKPDAVALPSIRLTVTTLFAMRALAWLLPPFLDLVESLAFQTLVAARHLRSKKSSFLAAIGTLSVLAVAFSSCSLTTTLSVMGGFRQDLKNKILGNNAHVRIDKEDGTMEGWAPILERVRGVEGVAAASPYTSGEVMVTSTSNIAGGVLRGIEPETVDDVTDLEQNMVRPEKSLEYLREPKKLLDVPADVMGPLPLQTPGGDSAEPAGEAGSPVRDMEKLVGGGGSGAGKGVGPGPDPPDPEPPDGAEDGGGDDVDPFLKDDVEDQPDNVLPGIVVGQELARTLRLTVGDEVNVVTPFGDLGPAGPMPKSRPYRVAGVFYSGMYEYDMKYTYVRLEDGQRYMSLGDAITGIEIKVDNVEEAPNVADRVESMLGRDDLRVRDWQELNRNLFGALALEKLAMFITLGIAILVAGFCVFGTLTLMVQEKGREVAILQAMGTPRRGIVTVFLFEGLLIGLFGAAVGLGLGFVVCYAAEHFGIRMNPEVYYIDKLPVHIDALEFTLVGVASVVVCLVATIFPAVLASRTSPVDALRYE